MWSYINETIPTKLLKHVFKTSIESFSVEISLWKRKWFLNDFYTPHKSKFRIPYLNLLCSKYSKICNKFISTDDFNAAMSNKAVEDGFCVLNNRESLIKKPTLQNSRKSNMHWSDFYKNIQPLLRCIWDFSDFDLLINKEVKMDFQKKKNTKQNKPKITPENYSILRLEILWCK